MIQCDLQAGLQLFCLQGAGIFRAARQIGVDPLDLLARQLPVAGQLLQLVAALALRELGFTQLPFRSLELLALVLQRLLGLFEPPLRRIDQRLQFLHLLALPIDGCVGDVQAFALALFLGGHFGQAGVDLRLPLMESFAGLRKLQCADLQRVCPALQSSHLLARFVQAVLHVGEAPLDFAKARLRLHDVFLTLGNHRRQCVDLALAFEQAMPIVVRRKQRHTLPADDVAAGGDATGARRQAVAARQCSRQIGSAVHLAKPVGKNRRQCRIGATNSRQQQFVGRQRRRSYSVQRQQQGQFASRPILAPRRIGGSGGQGGQAFAQDGFDGILPAGFDLQCFPQRFAVLQAMPAQPVVELAVGLQPLLQLLQCHPAGLRLGTFPLRVLHLSQNRTPLLLETRQFILLSLLNLQCLGNTLAQVGKLLLLGGKIDSLGNQQRRAFDCQTFAAAGDPLQRTQRMPTIRLFDVQALFGLGHLGTLAIDRRQRSSVPFLGQRQALLARIQAKLAVFDTFVGKRQQILPAFLFVRQLAGLCLPMRPVFGQLRQPCFILAP
ncbi:MAG: hypothetical protein AW09_003405 [Candidatus Accumulibacter phosphatis]|uniref:Uncharacterized protein n=1 Tax=Candidatus Accumulibacter phosphatis TaxID=327160 RepID=A0A080LSQ7_9PROT|nr:MAG: hypothetical protein AW09_003405 [Candidatus Accumulibacter phosphatis]